MSLPLRREERTYTYGDYLEWPDDERWELIHGVPYDMTPAPSRRHQEILGELHGQFRDYLKGKTCKVYLAPFDVRLPEGGEPDERVATVVQPDLVVVCDLSKLDEMGCRGAPDIAVEILSPSTARKDLREKLRLYEEVGVKEYWVVDPLEKVMMVFKLSEAGQYGKPDVYGRDDEFKVGLFEELSIDLGAVFEK